MTTETESPRVYRVKNPNQSLPIPWVWKDPETGKIITGDALSLIVEEVTSWLLANGRDAGAVEDEVHERTAAVLISKNLRKYVVIQGDVKRTMKQYLSGGKALMMSWWEQSPISGLIRGELERGREVHVDQEEADRRARICCQVNNGDPCDENVVPVSKSWAQSWTDGKMLESVEGKKTEFHDDLGVCKACTCELRAAIWWKPNILVASMKSANYEKKLPSHCWKLHLNNKT